jgi:His-Xaa-Ser system radical SAM maturase HxsC
MAEHLRLLDLIDPGTESLGVTGGEPTLFGKGLVRLVERAKERLPGTGLHVLTNGRLFYYGDLAEEVAAVGHPDLTLGVPLYADVDEIHDYVVQSRGAFDETMVGLQNLGRCGLQVEIRVVLHRETIPRLTRLAEFIYRNLTFTSHVALMGLEWTGFTLAHPNLWIDPWDYRDELSAATFYLADRGINVSIYNHQLCTLPEPLWSFSRRSISDWKNEYLPVCTGCAVRDLCAGFFAWNRDGHASSHIHPTASRPPD